MNSQIRTAIRAHGPNWIDYFSLQIDVDSIDADDADYHHATTPKKLARNILKREQKERGRIKAAIKQERIKQELHNRP